MTVVGFRFLNKIYIFDQLLISDPGLAYKTTMMQREPSKWTVLAVIPSKGIPHSHRHRCCNYDMIYRPGTSDRLRSTRELTQTTYFFDQTSPRKLVTLYQ